MNFSKVVDGIVENVIVADQSFIDSGALGNPALFYLTDFYTRGNVHYNHDWQPDGLPPYRGNYGENGFTWDAVNQVFYAPCPGVGYILDHQTWLWVLE